jgi:hypothetical protein
MVDKKDVIITVYSCSAMAPCSRWASSFFKDEPLVVVVPTGQFRQKAQKWAKTGDMFKAAAKDMLKKDIEVNRRALVTFSLGWIFADEMFKYDEEINKLDAYLLLDGCHTKFLNNWIKFAARAIKKDAFMAMAHTEIKPPFISSTETNTKILRGARKLFEEEVKNIDVPEFVSDAKLPDNGITVSLGAAGSLPPISKKWTKDPLVEQEVIGNAVKLHYSGNDRPDHVYIAWQVNKVLWNWLGDMWSTKEKAEEVVEEVVEPIAPEPPNKEEETNLADKPKEEKPKEEKEKPQKNLFEAIIAFIMMLISKIFKTS